MTEVSAREEYWLSGPVEGVPGLLQPVAHALLQAREEIHEILKDFDNKKLWDRPKKLASVGFHLQHIAGVLDRLFTYASGDVLSGAQLKYLSEEGQKNEQLTLQDLILSLSAQVDKSIASLKTVNEKSLTDLRSVGRKQLPSTVAGLLFHAAEHTMRHCGQLLVTAKLAYD